MVLAPPVLVTIVLKTRPLSSLKRHINLRYLPGVITTDGQDIALNLAHMRTKTYLRPSMTTVAKTGRSGPVLWGRRFGDSPGV